MTSWDSLRTAYAPVGLIELDETASLQRRVDRKYLVTPATWAEVVGDLAQTPRVLEIDELRAFRYESVYYDTPDRESFRAAAHRRPRRYKVRTRRYLDTGGASIEVKLRSRTGDTVKHRAWLSEQDVTTPRPGGSLPPAAWDFVASFPHTADAVGALVATLTTTYERTTLLTDDARVTVDERVVGTSPTGAAAAFPHVLIVETKSASRAGEVDRALWRHGARPQKVSKYCTSLAAIESSLPANRWSRTLRTHVQSAAPVHPAAPARAGA